MTKRGFPLRPWVAQYGGRCAACGHPIEPGQWIRWWQGSLRHEVCGEVSLLIPPGDVERSPS